MLEIWKPVKNYEGYYEVSNLGRVKRLERLQTYPDGHTQNLKEYISNGALAIYGYLQVSLSKDGKRTKRYIHDLVAESFIPNPNNLKEVNHKDYNKANNRVTNLEWCTHQENMTDMFKHYGKNKISNFCRCCGKEISTRSVTNLCIMCYKEQSTNKDYGEEYITSGKGITVNRDVLKNQIRTQSFLSLGKFYGVTDNAVRKWCKNFNLPSKKSDIVQISDSDWSKL